MYLLFIYRILQMKKGKIGKLNYQASAFFFFGFTLLNNL